MEIQILVDNSNSWYMPFARLLRDQLVSRHFNASLISDHDEIKSGDIMFILSCEKIVKKKHRDLHRHNIVVHASDLPKGRGWSPLTWQILEGKNHIPVTLIKAEDAVDSGDIYIKDFFQLSGHELIDEIREKLGHKINDVCIRFAENINSIKPVQQTGEPDYYPRRKPADSELDVHKTISEQFDLFRIADNKRYPLKFTHRNARYKVLIYKDENPT